MRIILTKAERESANQMKNAIVSYLEAEGIASASQSVVDDYSKGISAFRDQEGNTIIDIKTEFVQDVFNTFKKVGVLFLKVALPFAQACERIGELLIELDSRWATSAPASNHESEKEDQAMSIGYVGVIKDDEDKGVM